MTKDIKMVGLVALGVMVAGYAMNVFYNISVVKQASDGFDM